MNSDLGYEAAKEAIYDANIEQEEIDYIIFASNFGEVSKNGIRILCRIWQPE
jgi:3-oxoacyl-[acyl-carrier-protein] synthase-3